MGEDRAFEAKKSGQRPWGWRGLARRLRWPKSSDGRGQWGPDHTRP